MALHRWVASAEDLVLGSGRPTIGEVQPRGDLPPVCTEPYCGGFYWDSPAPAFLDRRGRPFPELKGEGVEPSGDSTSSTALPFPISHPLGGKGKQLSAEQGVEDAFRLAKGETTAEEQDREAEGQASAVDERAKQAELARANGHLKRLDFPDVMLFPHRESEAARHMRFGPSNPDKFDWWNVPNALQVVVKDRRDLELLQDVLNPFLHVWHPALVAGKLVPKGLQLVGVEPRDGKLRLYPRLGEKSALMADHLPVKLTFGGQIAGRPQPNDTPVVERQLNYTRPYKVKRLDFVFQPHQTWRDIQPERMLAAPAGVASGFLELRHAAPGRPRGARPLRDFLAGAGVLAAASG